MPLSSQRGFFAKKLSITRTEAMTGYSTRSSRKRHLHNNLLKKIGGLPSKLHLISSRWHSMRLMAKQTVTMRRLCSSNRCTQVSRRIKVSSGPLLSLQQQWNLAQAPATWATATSPRNFALGAPQPEGYRHLCSTLEWKKVLPRRWQNFLLANRNGRA